MRSASSAARSCSLGALLLLAVLALPGPSLGSDLGAHLTAAPTVTLTVPANATVAVNGTDPIEVRFVEAMDPATLLYATVPAANLTVSWPTSSLLRLTPGPPYLANCTLYEVEVRANDSDEGLPLVRGPVPNPWSFMTSCDRPYVTATDPVDGANNVSPATDIVVTFSEAMDCLTNVRINFMPFLPPPASFIHSCDASHTVLTVNLTRTGTFLVPGVRYRVSVNLTGEDGNWLVDSPLPNPWWFTVNAPPSVSAPVLNATGCVDSGQSVRISWTVSDDLDAPANLSIGLAYYDGVTLVGILDPTPGFPSPGSYDWTLPYADLETRVVIVAIDTAGALAWNTSASFRVDTGAPDVLLTVPADGATGVALGATITIRFTEPMDRASVEAAISSVPALPGLQFVWDADDRVRLQPGGLPDRTTFRITVARTALDTCGPGRPLAADHVFTFTTERAMPSAPASLNASAVYDTSVSLAWEPVATYVNGRPIPANATVVYRVFRGNATELGERILETSGTTATDTGLTPSTLYAYRVVAVVDGDASGPTVPLFVTTLDPLFETNAGRISLGVAALAVLGALLVAAQMRRIAKRRRAEAQLAEDVEAVVAQVRRVRTELDPIVRRREEKALQARFAALVKGGGEETEEGFRPDPRLEGLYRALARALVHSPEVDVSRGRAIVDRKLGDLAVDLREHGAAYRLLSEAEASVQSPLFATLPESARKALFLVYFYGLEEYLHSRLKGLIPAGATILLGERGHISTRRRGWESQWASLTLGNLLYALGHNARMFVADEGAWGTSVEPLLRQTVEARNRTAHPSREAPPLERVRDLVYGAIPAIDGVLRSPRAS